MERLSKKACANEIQQSTHVHKITWPKKYLYTKSGSMLLTAKESAVAV